MQDTFFSFWGTVSEISAFGIKIEGFNDFIGVGDEIRIACENLHVLGEILHIGKSDASALLFENANAIRIGDRVSLQSSKTIQIGPHWQGAVVDYRGLPMTEQASHHCPRQYCYV